MAEFEKILIEFFTGDGMTIARTVAVFIFGLLAVKLILLIVNKLSVRAHIDKTISCCRSWAFCFISAYCC